MDISSGFKAVTSFFKDLFGTLVQSGVPSPQHASAATLVARIMQEPEKTCADDIAKVGGKVARYFVADLEKYGNDWVASELSECEPMLTAVFLDGLVRDHDQFSFTQTLRTWTTASLTWDEKPTLKTGSATSGAPTEETDDEETGEDAAWVARVEETAIFWNNHHADAVRKMVNRRRTAVRRNKGSAYRTAPAEIDAARTTCIDQIDAVMDYLFSRSAESDGLPDPDAAKALKAVIWPVAPAGPDGADPSREAGAASGQTSVAEIVEPVLSENEVRALFEAHVSDEPDFESWLDAHQANLFETAKGTLDKELAKALSAFQNNYVTGFVQARDAENNWGRIREELGGNETVYAQKVPEGVFARQIWKQRISGAVRMVMRADGKLALRYAEEHESAVIAPFAAWHEASGKSRATGDQEAKAGSGDRGLLDGRSEDPRPSPVAGVDERAGPLVAYVDWTALPHRALPDGARSGDPNTSCAGKVLPLATLILSRESPAKTADRLVEFAAKLQQESEADQEVTDDLGTSLHSRARTRAIYLHKFEHMRTGPIVHTLETWLKSLPAGVGCEIALVVDRAGFSSTVFQLTGGALEPQALDNIAIVLSGLLKRAIDPSADFSGAPVALEPVKRMHAPDNAKRETFAIPTTLIHPLRIELSEEEAKGDIPSATDDNRSILAEVIARHLLGANRLNTLEVARTQNRSRAFNRATDRLQSDKVILQLASRFGQAIDLNLPFIVEGSGQAESRPNADRNNRPASTTIYRHMAKGNLRSSLLLVFVFFGILLFPTLIELMGRAFSLLSPVIAFLGDLVQFNDFPVQSMIDAVPWSQLPGLELNKMEAGLFTLVFFGVVVLRVIAIYGVERVIGNAQENTYGGSRLPGFHKRAEQLGVRTFKSMAGLLQPIWALLAVGVAFLILPIWELEEFLSTSDNRLYAGMIQTLIWALPAVSLGLLAQSANRFSTMVADASAQTAELDTLGDLKDLALTGSAYVDQARRSFAVDGKPLPNYSPLLARLPGFSRAEAAIARAEARVKADIETSRSHYVRNSAATVAVITLVAALGPLKTVEPDAPYSRPSNVEKFLMAGLIGEAPSEEISKQPAPSNPEAKHLPEAVVPWTIDCDKANTADAPRLLKEKLGETENAKAEEIAGWLTGLSIRCQNERINELKEAVADHRIGQLVDLLQPVEDGDGTRFVLPVGIDVDVVKRPKEGGITKEFVDAIVKGTRIPVGADLSIEGARLALKDANAETVDSQEALQAQIARYFALAVPAALKFEDWKVVLERIEGEIAKAQTPDGDDGIAGVMPSVKARLSLEEWATVRAGLQQIIETAQADLDTSDPEAKAPLAPEIRSRLTLGDWPRIAAGIQDEIDKHLAKATKNRPQLEVGLGLEDDALAKFVKNVVMRLRETRAELVLDGPIIVGEEVTTCEDGDCGFTSTESADFLSPVPKACAQLPLASFYFDSIDRTKIVCARLANQRTCDPAAPAPVKELVEHAVERTPGTPVQPRPRPVDLIQQASGGAGPKAPRGQAPVLAALKTRYADVADEEASIDVELLVVGFADSRGHHSNNMVISRDRAAAVQDLLLGALPVQNIKAIWRGEEWLSSHFSLSMPDRFAEARRADVYECGIRAETENDPITTATIGADATGGAVTKVGTKER